MLLYAATFILALITFAVFFEQEYALVETISALGMVCLFSLVLGVPRFLEFKKISKKIRNSGISRNTGKYGQKELLIASIGVVFFTFAILGPFILAFVAPPTVWLGAVLGMVAGISGSQLAFASYTMRWEKINLVKLYRYTVWFRDERNRRVVTEYGVRSERS